MSAAPARSLALGLSGAAVLSLCAGLGTMVVPLYDMHLFDRVLHGRSLETLAFLTVLCGAALLWVGAVIALRARLMVLLAAAVANGLLPGLLPAAAAAASAGDRATGVRALQDLREVRHAISSGLVLIPLDLLFAPALLLALFALHPALGWYAVASAALLLAASLLTDALARPLLADGGVRMERAMEQAAAPLADPAAMLGLGLRPAVAARWVRAHAAALERVQAATRRGDAMAAACRFLRMVLQGGNIALGASLVLQHQVSPGAMIGANVLLALVLAPLDSALAQWRAVSEAALAWRRVAAWRAPAAPAAVPADTRAGIVLTDARLAAGGRTILAGVDLTVAPGSIVALTGANGSGKSVLLRVMAGIAVPQSGTAVVCGIPAPQAAACGLIGLAPQRPQLLEGTLAENIGRFAAEGLEKVVRAARDVGIHDAIGRLPRGYATPIGPLDPLLSDGQKQLVAIARALCGAPPVLLLDEPDASLDAGAEQRLIGALQAARDRGAAIVVITHRQGIRAIADRRVTLHDGVLHDD